MIARQPTFEDDQKMLSSPSREEVEALLRQDALRGFRVDIESDSTIRGDLARNQRNLLLFLQGTGAYMQTIGPGVREGYVPAEAAIEIYAAFARQFKLGKQAEDALDRLADDARRMGKGGQGVAAPMPAQPAPAQPMPAQSMPGAPMPAASMPAAFGPAPAAASSAVPGAPAQARFGPPGFGPQ